MFLKFFCFTFCCRNKQVKKRKYGEMAKSALKSFAFGSKELAVKALCNMESKKLVQVASLNENCCLFIACVNALRLPEQRIAFVGGADRVKIPTQFFKDTTENHGEDGFKSYDLYKYLAKLRAEGLISSFKLKKCEGYKTNKGDQYYFHVSRIFSNLSPGTILLFCGFSLPPIKRREYTGILVAKKLEYQKSGQFSCSAIERFLEIYSERELYRPTSLCSEMKRAFVDTVSKQSRHVCAVSKDVDGRIFKYDNSNVNRQQIKGLEDLLPYIFFYTETLAFNITV